MSGQELPPFNKQLEIGSGRFGVLYIDPRDPTRCIKRLKSPVRGKEAENLNRLVDLARWARPSEVHHLVTRFAWPLEVEGGTSEVTAFTMPRAPESCYFNLSLVSRLADRARPGSFTETRKDRRETLQLKYLIDDSWWQGQQVRSRKPEVDEPGRIEIAIDVCDSLLVLHHHGLVYGDISSNNVVARLDDRPGAYFFDADSISPAEFRALEPLVSPGWETPFGLDPFAIDRSRCALVVLRLLTEIPNARPSDSSLLSTSSYVVRSLLPLISVCFESGREDTFLDLITQLRTLRAVPSADRVFEDVIKLGYARTILREEVNSRTASQRLVIEQAKAQILFEDQVDNSEGLEFRRLIRQANLRMGIFKLDARPRFEPLKPIRSEDDLVELLFDGSYQGIANVLTSTGLGSLEQHFAVNRAVGYALLQSTPGAPQLDIEPGKATCIFRWPREDFVNCARVRARYDNGKEEFQIYRRKGSSSESRVISCPRGSRLDIQVEYGSRSASGTEFYPTFGQSKSLFLHESAQIPPLPRPARPTLPGQSLPVAEEDWDQPDMVIIDPEAERLQRELLAMQARRTKRRRLIAAALALVLLPLIYFGYRTFFDGPGFRSLTRAQSASAPEDWAISSKELQLATVSPSSLYVDFEWKRLSTTKYRIQFSRDGNSWSPPEKVDIAKSGATFRFDFSEDGTPPLFLVEAVDGEGNVVQREFFNILHNTGFDQYPLIEVQPEQIRILIDPTDLPGEPRPIAFIIKGTSTVNGRTSMTYLKRVVGTEFFVPLDLTSQISNLKIRSIFAAGEFGPWVGKNL